jgi:hypothetical protein
MGNDAVLLVDHVPSCAAVEAVRDSRRWPAPWSGIPIGTLFRANDGTRRGHRVAWLILGCTDTQCPAVKLVRADKVAEIGEGMP